MKKTISLLLALLLITTCFAFHSPEANALGAVWVKEFYKDKFGDPTEEFSQLKGYKDVDTLLVTDKNLTDARLNPIKQLGM